jgi:hypothetical protein
MPTNAENAPTPEDVHTCLKAFYDGDGRTPFILSLDGGGIYGLTTAIWLRQLCEQVPGFLVPGQVRLFAGTSSGAINCLLMAMHEAPREAVLSGQLERFWKGTGVFSNQNAWTRSLGGHVTSLFGTEDFLNALRDEFGDMTLGDMKNRALISTYNWTGTPTEKQTFGTPFDGPDVDWSAFRPENVFRPWERTTNQKTRAGQTHAHWRPKFFDSHGLTTTDRDIKVVDVAYAAACVPGLRSLRGGLGDGASFNANPSVSALAHLMEQWEACVKHGLPLRELTGNANPELDVSPREQIRRIIADGFMPHQDRPQPYLELAHRWKKLGPKEKEKEVKDASLDHEAWVTTQGKGILLAWTKMLSVGSGQALPALGYSNIDVGSSLWQQLPTSPFDGVFLPSTLFALDAPATAAEYSIRRLLHDERSLRLNPDLMPIPTVLASIMAINPGLRAYITKMIYDQTESAKSKNAVSNAAKFLEQQATFGTDWYHDEPGTTKTRCKEQLATWNEHREGHARGRKPLNPFALWWKAAASP